MPGGKLGLFGEIVGANLRDPHLPYKVTFVATYNCNFRCEMCSIWKKKSVSEMTPAEVGAFFRRWPQFRWVHLTGGEIFMRRDIDDVVAAIQENCRSLFLLNFPSTGWFGDRTVALANQILQRGVGRLMMTISIDGPPAVHEEMRGLKGSWARGVDTYRRLRAIKRPNFQAVVGMTLMAKNTHLVRETAAAIRKVIPDFQQSELHLNVGHESDHYFGNTGFTGGGRRQDVLAAIEAHRQEVGKFVHPVDFLENRYQGLIPRYFESGKSPLPCTALSSSCFIDAHWNLYPCSIWDQKVGNLRDASFDLEALWHSQRGRSLRTDVVNENCAQCWTPCEAYPTILGNLARAVTAGSLRPKASPAEAGTAEPER
jgi:MoaA/NifB/PqqE/SkfB family radical SAM enzyme